MKTRVLFVCIHNSARSQMAEAFLNHHCGEFFAAESAGIEPGRLNLVVVEAMAEAGIDISHHGTKSVADMLRAGRDFSYVVTVCDETSAERCPVFPGNVERLHWGFPDPSALTGTHEQKLERTREIRNLIRERVDAFCAEHCTPANA